jgi:hypothetical protein
MEMIPGLAAKVHRDHRKKAIKYEMILDSTRNKP